jgi:hypothetical protein
VATPGGTATGSADFVAVAKPFTAATVGTTGVLGVDGAASTVAFGTAGKAALLRFSGTKGQRLSLGLTGSTAGDLYVYGYTPFGAAFARSELEGPWSVTALAGGLALPPLPASGTYQIALKPVTATATGSVTATLSTRVNGTLSLTGAGTAVSLSRAGQQADLTFAATAGQQIGIGFSGATFTGASYTAQIVDGAGIALLWNAADGSKNRRVAVNGAGSDLDIVAPTTGTYTLTFGTNDAGTGAVTVTASVAQNLGALSTGAALAVSVTRPGQDVLATFTATAGQLLSLDFESATSTYLPAVFLTGPDGVQVAQGYTTAGGRFDFPALPSAGTFTLRISLSSGNGTFSLRLLQRQSAGALSLTSAGTTVALAAAGAQADLTFSGTAATVYTFAFSGWTLPSTATVRARFLDPSGAVVKDSTTGSLGVLVLQVPSTGTYHLLLNASTNVTGSALVTWSQRVQGGTLTAGSTSAISVTRPGQQTLFTFAGTAGQRLGLMADTYSFTHAVIGTLYSPDGTVLYTGSLRGRLFDLATLPANGTYSLLLQPYADTGALTFVPIIAVNGGVTTVGGTAPTFTAPSGGRYLDSTFTLTANQRLSLGFTGWTFTSTTLLVRISNSAGEVLYENTLTKTGSLDYPAFSAGTYRLDFVATDRGGGAVAVTASAQINGSTITLNTAKSLTAPRIAQSTYATYAGTTGQTLAVTYTSVTMTYYPHLLVLKPDGTVLADLAGAATQNIPALPTTGNYGLTFSPYSASGNATATLKTRTALAGDPTVTADPRSPVAQPPARTVPASAHTTTVAQPKSRRPAAAPRTATGPQPAAVAGAGETWRPNRDNLSGAGWTTGRATSVQNADPLRAPTGTTALSGRILTLQDKPLANVTVSVGTVTSTTDTRGRFLLSGLPPGHRVLRVDGTSASSPGRTFGLHDIGVDLTDKATTVLPYTIWLSRLDTQHTVKFASPATHEVVVKTPAVPGLEVHLPAGTVVRDVNGKIVTELGITAIPVDRTPFPLPRSQVPSYFTVQPGSSYVFPTGARVIYPNFTHAPAGTSMDFWHYDPEDKGWFVYGKGTVTKDGKRVEPNKGTEVYQFTGAMLITPNTDPPPDLAPANGGATFDGDPVTCTPGWSSTPTPT